MNDDIIAQIDLLLITVIKALPRGDLLTQSLTRLRELRALVVTAGYQL